MSVNYRTLIFEPDASSAEELMRQPSMKADNFVWCCDSVEAISLLEQARIDVAVVSLSPQGLGQDITGWLSKSAGKIPFMIVTPGEALETRMLGLNSGAIDYLIKPFTADELLSRIATVMRRREPSPERYIRRGKMVLDKYTGKFGDGSRWTILSPAERKILALLFGCGDQPVSKQALKSALADGTCPTDNAVEVSVHRVRAKARTWGLSIRTYWGLGYLLEEIQ